MQTMEDLGALFLSSRLKRLSDSLYDEVDKIYGEQSIELNSRWTAILFLLHVNGDSAITQLADYMGQTHPAISQLSRKLLQVGYIENKPDKEDERRRLLGLTQKGRQLIDTLQPIWEELRVCLNERIDACEHDLLKAIVNMESKNHELPLSEQVLQRQQLKESNKVEIIAYDRRFADDFKRLNVEWLEKYFYVEAIDDQVLSNPEEKIINPGGQIFFAQYNGEIIGTGALLQETKGIFELTKMAVTEKYQGLKVGRKIMEAVIEAFREAKGTLLFLESNSRLKPALHLYESMGFVHKEKRPDSHYQRADVYMVFEE